MARNAVLEELIRPAVEATGFEFWGLEYLAQGKHSVLRVFIDHENGIDVDNCAEVSHQVSGVLDLEDPIQGYYNLEVSSPGMDRPLFTEAQFAMYPGEEVEMRSAVAVNGRRKFKGTLEKVENGLIYLLVDGESFEIPCQQVEKANLVVNF
ncbi:ribosome maturation factor RimP [Kangiella sp. HZ709]|uniref:ribosome maturation factor RimP n=1 Tax=Kangiella sp. HZ709 TaxID=2666328 RepID=UPI0012AF3305|nr:ribosome maturation factor RimP [Kangiella sp. HZ709]MRX27742.1 ribosome maturation factor RimP [Kangiella sp. HZ709]